MRRALVLARRGWGRTAPNPMVGAVVVRGDRCLGEGWHHRAGEPHAEVLALRAVEGSGHRSRGATLVVTLEPCSTHGRTPPCTEAILAAGIGRVVVGGVDPNPRHAGRGLEQLRAAGVEVVSGVLAEAEGRLNQVFRHWIVGGTPWVTLKAAMTLDGKIATADGESQWITGPAARAVGHRLRWGVEAVMVGVETVLADDPQLVCRRGGVGEGRVPEGRVWLRVVVDSRARTPLGSRVVTDGWRERTVVVVTDRAPRLRVKALEERVRVVQAPAGADGRVDLGWLMRWLGEVPVTSVLVESGGELGGSLVRGGWVQEVAFFYAPMILGGARGRKAVAGEGALSWDDTFRLTDLRWRRCGEDLWLGARLVRDRAGRG